MPTAHMVELEGLSSEVVMHIVLLCLKLVSAKSAQADASGSANRATFRVRRIQRGRTAALVELAVVVVERAGCTEIGQGAGLSATAQLILVRALPLAVAQRAGWTCDQQNLT